MTVSRTAAESDLDDICRGVANDVFLAELARRLLEELDGAVDPINQTGIGKRFFADLQVILQHELILTVTRMYEPYSSRNPGRTLPATVHHIETHAANLPIVNHDSVLKYLVSRGHPRQSVDQLSNERLSLTLAKSLDGDIPRADMPANSPLNHALGQLKMVRDKAIAHHDQVRQSSLLIPGWSHLVNLIDIARETVSLVAHAYLSVGYNLAGDASWGAHSLRGLLDRAGLGRGPDCESNLAEG
jgi:hypothetical protein